MGIAVYFWPCVFHFICFFWWLKGGTVKYGSKSFHLEGFFLRPQGEISSGVSHYEGATHTVIENHAAVPSFFQTTRLDEAKLKHYSYVKRWFADSVAWRRCFCTHCVRRRTAERRASGREESLSPWVRLATRCNIHIAVAVSCVSTLSQCASLLSDTGVKHKRLPSDCIISKDRTKKNTVKPRQNFAKPLAALLLACCCVQQGHCCYTLCPFWSLRQFLDVHIISRENYWRTAGTLFYFPPHCVLDQTTLGRGLQF